MHHGSLADRTDTKIAVPPQSFGAGAITGATIDTLGWDGACFEISIGAITGAGVMDAYVKRDAASAFTTSTNVTNAALTQVTNANPNTTHVIDVYRPSARYLKLIMTQATNTVVAGATVTLYRRSGLLPPTSSAIQVVKVAEN